MSGINFYGNNYENIYYLNVIASLSAAGTHLLIFVSSPQISSGRRLSSSSKDFKNMQKYFKN
jgi:hypothetical protein